MDVSKNIINKELRGKFWLLKLLAFLISKSWSIKLINKFINRNKGADIPGLNCEERYILSRNGSHKIRVRIFKPLVMNDKLPGMLYLHSGGYITGSPEFFSDVIKRFIEVKPCVIVAPAYRSAMDAAYHAVFDDCYDTLLWLKDNAEKLGIIADSFIVAGHSAGGGLTAAIALKARDTKDVNIAFQMPVYPMIDDRQLTKSASYNKSPVWNSISNKYAWNKYLRGYKEKNLEIPSYAAPARVKDYTGLPPAITIVGELDNFRDETVEYVENLKKADIPVQFKIFKGCFHAFEIIIPEAKISMEAWRFILGAFSDYIDKYIKMEK